jgi:hypothetical protein
VCTCLFPGTPPAFLHPACPLRPTHSDPPSPPLATHTHTHTLKLLLQWTINGECHSPLGIAKALIDKGLADQSKDNMSAIVVALPNAPAFKPEAPMVAGAQAPAENENSRGASGGGAAGGAAPPSASEAPKSAAPSDPLP